MTDSSPTSSSSRPVPAAADPAGLVPPPAAAAANANAIDPRWEGALEYVALVRRERPDLFGKFREVLVELGEGRYGVLGVVVRTVEMFWGCPDLVLGLGAFLPPGHRIELMGGGMGGDDAASGGRGGDGNNEVGNEDGRGGTPRRMFPVYRSPGGGAVALLRDGMVSTRAHAYAHTCTHAHMHIYLLSLPPSSPPSPRRQNRIVPHSMCDQDHDLDDDRDQCQEGRPGACGPGAACVTPPRSRSSSRSRSRLGLDRGAGRP